MTNNNLYLAIDQGGGSTRAIVFDAHSKLIAKASQAIGVEHPRLGWVEQDAENIYDSVKKVLQGVGSQLGGRVSAIKAAGIATQRSNVVCWRNSNGEALSPAISWQDRRAYQWMEQFNDQLEIIRQKTGLVVSPHYGVSKINWCLENLVSVQKALQENDLSCGPLASFLVARMTGNFQSLVDPANASRTLLWNVHDGQWDEQLVELFGLSTEYLPQCTSTFSDFGHLDMLGHEIPLSVVTGDQSAALYAYGNPAETNAYINMGTGVFIQYPTGGELIDIPGLLCSMVYRDSSRSEFVIESTINGAANALMEIEDALGVSGEEAERNLALWFDKYTQPPLFLNGVAGLAAPYWVPDFTSRFVGAGCAEEKILAVAESILFLIKVNIETIRGNGRQIKEVKVTGGLSNSDCLCQKLANLLQVPIVRAEQTEATAMGLAYLIAESPHEWAVTGPVTMFSAKQDDNLHQRFEAWNLEMNNALKKYKC